MRTKLTARGIEKLIAIGAPGRWPDSDCPGLNFVITKQGARSWTYRYSFRNVDREMGLGPLRKIPSVEEARQRGWDAVKQVLNGIDPLAAREQVESEAPDLAKTITFAECGARYIANHKAGWKNAKHAAQWESTLRNHAYPVIGAVPVATLDTSHVMQVLEQDADGTTLWLATPETANRLRGRIEQILDWAKARGYRSGENPARWRGHIDKLLPAREKVRKRKHQPALAFVDIPAFMVDLRKRPGITAQALEVLTLTATRTTELVAAMRSEINWSAKTWTIPAERMKAAREHRVPLSDRAIAILKALPTEEHNPYLFVGGRVGSHLSTAAMWKLMQEMKWPSTTPGKLAVPHGLRSTFRDWAGEMTNFPRDLAEAALAHGLESETEAAYRRGTALEKRRKLMSAWAAYCAAPVPKGEVLQMPQHGSAVA